MHTYVKSSLKNVKLIIECVYRGLKYLWPKNLEFSFCNTYFFIRLGATSSRVQGIALLSVKKQTFSKACNKVLYYLKLPTLKNQESLFVQVNLCQNMGRTCFVQKLFWMSETISVHNMFSPVLSLEFSCKYWTCT